MRIYVGGLGSLVKEPDLKKTFTSPQLGTVQSVEIIRTKGRSFAYLEFLPASDKGLSKLFSTYNGCLWRGGRLRLEKAKEDYLVRLRREWEEDAQTVMKLVSQNVDEDESLPAIQKPKKDQDISKMQLKIFFPKLRKIKPVPLKGTGKHKYSFQRVEVPPLPIHFCDCEEHCGPPEPTKRNYTDNHETNNFEVNEDERNMMKSILNKLLQKETCSETVSNEADLTEEKNHDASLADNGQVSDIEEDQESDEDNLVINMVGQSTKRVTSFEDCGLKTTTTNQDLWGRERESFSNPISEKNEAKKVKHILVKKRKQSIPEDKSNDTAPSQKKGKKGGRNDRIDDLVIVNTPIDKESGPSGGAEKSNKPSWRSLVSEKAHTAFTISDILTDHSEGETKSISDHLETAHCSNINGGRQDQSNKDEESEKLSDVPIPEDKSNDTAPSQKKRKKGGRNDCIDDLVIVNTPIDKESCRSGGAEKSNKPSWRSMDSEKAHTAFTISDILTDHNSEGETKPISDHLETTAHCSNKNDGQQDQLSKDEESEKISEAHLNKATSSEDKSGRGDAWLKKSSWLQLVGDANTSAFNLSQILPEVTFAKQELQQPHSIDFSHSRSLKQQGIVQKDQETPLEEISEPQGRGGKDIYATPGNPKVDILEKQQTYDGRSNSDSKVTVSEDSIVGDDLVQSNRGRGDIVISENCPFMRSAASMKEWVKCKAALRGSHKKKEKERS